MTTRKIQSGRVITLDSENFIGEKGVIFYNENLGDLRLSDGQTPGGTPIVTGGGSAYILRPATPTRLGGVKIGDNININTLTGVISVATPTDLLNVSSDIIPFQDDTYNIGSETAKFKSIYVGTGTVYLGNIALTEVDGYLNIISPGGETTVVNNYSSSTSSLAVSEINSLGLISNTVTNVTAIRFDKDTGFNVTDLGSGEIKVSLGSSFKTWTVSGQQPLVAQGEDTVEIVAGNGVTLTTHAASPKSLTIDTDPGNAETNTDFLFLYQISL